MALNGLDPMRFLRSRDRLEIIVMRAVSARVGEIRAEAAKG